MLRLLAENHALTNSLPGTAGFPPVDFPEVSKMVELPVNILGDRIAFKDSTNHPGAGPRPLKFIPSMCQVLWTPVRDLSSVY